MMNVAFPGSFGMTKCPAVKEIDKDKAKYDLFWNSMYQTRYDNLILYSWWLLKEPFVVLFRTEGF